MMYIIEKKQTKIDNFKMNTYYFSSARDSFEYILKEKLKEKKILIPAYIGFSTNEGSGIFDPIKKSGIAYEFYKLSKNLEIEKESLFKLIDANPNNILLLVHYFGFLDSNIGEIKEYAKKKNMVIIEDCAHAFFTFFQKPIVDSDYYLFSLHKMFPHANGGMLISKKPLNIKESFSVNPFEYNFYEISNARVQNYNYLKDKLKVFDKITLLKPLLKDEIPQTLPILLPSEKLRDHLYFKLNALGFGAVSLYHELIQEVTSLEYENEFYLSHHILNLPVHQDIVFEDLDKMVETLGAFLDE
ncbi:MAG: DegT/DnrJ/EryC1/StrS family aminotransferase [Campylobacterales bacterium]|nr:DegT/DnrJ/EryC1/StrS family aminotransferase [Campylobacterales bacterium]